MMTGQDYRQSILRLKPKAYMFGREIEDLGAYGFTDANLRGIAETYDMARDPALEPLFVTTSHLSGRPISRYTHIHQSSEDLMARIKVARQVCRRTGVCLGRCGADSLNALWATTYDIDAKLGTEYHRRFKDFLRRVQDEDLVTTLALTDPKGDRGLRAAQQPDRDAYVRIVERRPDGIVVRGAKAMIAGATAAHEILVHPGTGFGSDEADYAVAFAIPNHTPGLYHVVDRQASDERKNEPSWDQGNVRYGSLEALIVFDDVFVPNERVFMAGEAEFAADCVGRFALLHRVVLAGCLAGCGDVLTGATALVAEANGLAKPMRDQLAEMTYYSEALYAGALGACSQPQKTASGAVFPDPLLANVSKWHISWMPYEIQKRAEEVTGGSLACMPSQADLESEAVGPAVRKYLQGTAAVPVEARMRAIRLVENLVAGPGRLGSLCMHGAGSPAAARITVRALSDIEKKKGLAKHLAGLDG
ncbi:MAG TPA: 4-hydroxyphenylacetate 3-hydroxylase N-terminal domain-containing protein [Bacillota bacterium]|jgi:4-hydroxybutyryl-CoA dehydratase/vinylacetyl-CoA-Delta-isomerase